MTPEGIEACADILGISAAEVSGVATFYTMYKRRPVGDYHVGVCTNTLCAVMGGDADLRAAQGAPRRRQRRDHRPTAGHPRARRVQRGLRLRPGGDGQLGVHGQPDPGVRHAAGRRPARRQGGPLHPRPAHLHLARGRAGAGRLPRRPGRRGPGRRAASLAGLEIARERGWTAPPGDTTGSHEVLRWPARVRPSRPTPPVPSRRPRSLSPRPRCPTRTTRRTPRRVGTTSDRHADSGAHRQLGRRPRLDVRVLRVPWWVRRPQDRAGHGARTRSSRR